MALAVRFHNNASSSAARLAVPPILRPALRLFFINSFSKVLLKGSLSANCRAPAPAFHALARKYRPSRTSGPPSYGDLLRPGACTATMEHLSWSPITEHANRWAMRRLAQG